MALELPPLARHCAVGELAALKDDGDVCGEPAHRLGHLHPRPAETVLSPGKQGNKLNMGTGRGS